MNLGTLNTIIALVLVLLVLSLVVHSIQTALKKLLTLKSKQIEESLKDLYEHAISAGPRPVSAPPTKLFAKLWAHVKGVKRAASPEAESFTNGVLQQFNSVGRINRIGKTVLDSLSKDDLLKVMARLELQQFFPGSFDKFKALCDRVTDLGKAVEVLTTNQRLAGAASPKISELRAVLAPLLVDVQANPTVPFQAPLATRGVDQNAAHCLGRRREEVPPVIEPLGSGQPQVGLVNERCRL